MARGRKTGGRDFVKGDPRCGRPKIPDDHKEALRQVQAWREENRFEYQEAFRRVAMFSVDELQEFAKGTSSRVVDLLVARAILRVLQSARIRDLETLRFLMCGDEPKQIELSGPGGEPLRPFAAASREELLVAWQKLQSFTIGEPTQCPSTPLVPQPSELSPPSLPPPSDTES